MLRVQFGVRIELIDKGTTEYQIGLWPKVFELVS